MRLLVLTGRLGVPWGVVGAGWLSGGLSARLAALILPSSQVLPAGQSAARLFLLQKPMQSRGCSDPRSRSRALTEHESAVALPAGRSFRVLKLDNSVPFEAETWGTPLEHEPEHIPVVPPEWDPPARELDKNSNWGLAA